MCLIQCLCPSCSASPSQAWNCALTSNTVTSDKSGSLLFVVDAAGGDGRQTAAAAAGTMLANFLR